MELDWLTFERLDVTDSIVYFAGQLARTHVLKGYDAVQLAAALSTNIDKMLTYDHKLARVATAVGLNVLS
jgi:predicted nucleic acid-binding protein